MKWRWVVLLALLVTGLGCARKGKEEEKRPLSSGDAVWLRDGAGSETTGLEDALLRAGFSAVYLPARKLQPENDMAEESLTPPPSPIARIPVVLVVAAGEAFETTLRIATGKGREAAIRPVVRAVSGALAERQRFGNVTGIHLDVPFSPESLETFADLVGEIRRELPGHYRLSASLRFSPGEKELGPLSELELDAWTVNVFGESGLADLLVVDALGKPWWAVYTPGARGVRRAADGSVKGVIGEKYLAALSDRPEVELMHDLTWKEEWASAFLLRPRAVVQAGELSFAPGEVVSFSQPSLPEMLTRLGSDLAGRRSARGRVIVLEGASEEERIFTLAALGDVLLGRPLEPDVRVTVGPVAARQVGIAAENASPHATVVSRTANWVEVELPSPGVRDVQPGGFDRYEVYDAQDRPVSLGRALRVRFFETLISARERVEPARITLRTAARAGCCRWRSRSISAAGRELATDWAAPEPTPAATPRPPR